MLPNRPQDLSAQRVPRTPCGARSGDLREAEHGSFPSRSPLSLIRRDAISVFGAGHNHGSVLFHSISKQLPGVFYAMHASGSSMRHGTVPQTRADPSARAITNIPLP